MKTLLFSPMYLDDGRLERHTKWFRHMLKTDLYFDRSFFVDNASSPENISKLPVSVYLHRCQTHLPRLEHKAYGYWYRAFRIGTEYAINNNFTKIIHIDTDSYVLSPRVCKYINDLKSGWTGFWSPKYRFPETAMQVICKDKFQVALDFFTDGFLAYYPYDIAENKVPFTHIEKSFKGDRYGEERIIQDSSMDYYCQAIPEIDLVYDMGRPRVAGPK